MLGSETSDLIHKLFYSNLWIFQYILPTIISITDPGLAINYQTTSAVTLIEGGVKVNVLPTMAKATINHRIVPGDSVASVLAHDITVVNDDRVIVTPL